LHNLVDFCWFDARFVNLQYQTFIVWAWEVMHEKRRTEIMPVLRFECRNYETAVVCVFEPIIGPTCFTIVDENLSILSTSLSGGIHL
jgi:hypothetical protein